MRDPKPLAPWIAVGSRSAGSTQPTWQRLLLAPHAKTYPPRPKLRHSLVHPARAVPHGRAQGFEVELGSRGRSGGTDRAGMSKCCPGLDRLAAMRALASRQRPRTPQPKSGDGTVRCRLWDHPRRQKFTGHVRQGGLAAENTTGSRRLRRPVPGIDAGTPSGNAAGGKGVSRECSVLSAQCSVVRRRLG